MTKNELKTLKDLDLQSKTTEPRIILHQLKQRQKEEAIKWIKASPDDIFFTSNRIEEWIKHFFNLTEEDLKK